VRDKNAVALTKPEKIRGRWREHFEQIYNKNIQTDPSVLLNLHVHENDCTGHDTPELLREEVEAAPPGMKSGKSPGEDNVTADEMKASCDLGIQVLHKLFLKVWESEVMLLDWSRAEFIPIFKKQNKMFVTITEALACYAMQKSGLFPSYCRGIGRRRRKSTLSCKHCLGEDVVQ